STRNTWDTPASTSRPVSPPSRAASGTAAPGNAGGAGTASVDRANWYAPSSRNQVVSTNGKVSPGMPQVLTTVVRASVTTVVATAPMTRNTHVSGRLPRNVVTPAPVSNG